MKAIILKRRDDNLSRVNNLVAIYEKNLAGSGQGRRPHTATDVLRAATVLLHATLEDFIRSLEYWKVPVASAEVLNKIPWEERRTKIELGDLAKHRGKTINEVIEESVRSYLDRSNYNSTDDLCGTLRTLQIDPAAVSSSFPTLQHMMMRRHQIVHRADQDDTGGSGNHRVKSLGSKTVRAWTKAVETFTDAVLEKL